MDGQTDRWVEGQMDRWIDGWRDRERQIDRQIDRQTDRQMDRQIDRQLGRQIDGQIYPAQLFAQCIKYCLSCLMDSSTPLISAASTSTKPGSRHCRAATCDQVWHLGVPARGYFYGYNGELAELTPISWDIQSHNYSNRRKFRSKTSDNMDR